MSTDEELLPARLQWRNSLVFLLTALSEDCITLSGQKHEGFGQLDDFSWQTPFAGNR